MTKIKLLFPAFLIFLLSIKSFNSFSQNQKHEFCGTTEMEQKLLLEHPEIAAGRLLLEKETKEYNQKMAQEGNQKVQGVVYIIPVVFHVLHEWGTENISDAQIIDQINILNKDFRKANADTNMIIPSFTGIASDSEIEFRLAQLDPNGNCTNGIDRIVTSKTNGADNNSKLNNWPHNKYLNIWTCKSMADAGVAGYAYYPGAPNGIDGIMVLSAYVGSIGTSSPFNSRVLTHEVGHYLNLPHVWGSNNSVGVACGDDGVSDTPITKGFSYCPQPANAAICNPPIIENFQNYMDYSYCCKMFTLGQKNKMRTALLSSVGQRNNLWTQLNLTATGTDGVNYTCVPLADFNPEQRFICEGASITFTDATMNLNSSPVTRLWNFQGGNPSTDTSANPVVQYNTVGNYDVSLTMTNSAGTDTKTVTGMVVVSPAQGISAVPFNEGFESIVIPGNDWYVANDAGTTWEQTSVAAHTGFTSMRIYNYTGNPSETYDNLITTSFDLSNVSNTQMYFWRAFAYRSNTTADALRIFASTNCGQLWSLRYVKTGTALATAGLVSSNFIPGSTQWAQDNVNLATSSVSGKPNVRFKFEYKQDSGNNFYLDDINLSGTVGVNEVNAMHANFEVFPNPAHAKAHISFSLKEKNDVQLKIYDVSGREVKTMVENNLPEGEYQYDVESTMDNGIYFVTLTIGDNQSVKKLVLN